MIRLRSADRKKASRLFDAVWDVAQEDPQAEGHAQRCDAAFNALALALAAALRAWIPCSEKEPDKPGSYLTYGVGVTWESYFSKDHSWSRRGITHWMQLPPRPKKRA